MLQIFFRNDLTLKDKVILVFAYLFTIMIAISFHEMSHAWQAYRLGDDTGLRAGRITMNPMAHLDPIGTIMLMTAGIGWAKPTPINPVLFTRSKTMKRGIIEVSLAGPFSNLVLAFASYFLLQIAITFQLLAFKQVSTPNPVMDVIFILFQIMVFININLAIFNLLPIPPLDGYKIFGSLLPGELYYKIMQYERYIGMVFLFLIFFAGNTLINIMSVLRIPFEFIIQTPLDLLFTWIRSFIS